MSPSNLQSIVEVTHTSISIRGVTIDVPATVVDGKIIVLTGTCLRVASIKDEDFQEGDLVPEPQKLIQALRQNGRIAPDIFAFSQKLTDLEPRFPYRHELDSVAAIHVVSFNDWWNNQVSTDLRCDVRKAAKRGVIVRTVPFTDELVRGIMEIYDETPVRHGRPFWHYRKGFDAVKRENETYLNRSIYLGAFVEAELCGFLKIVRVNRIARLMQIIAKEAHRDKRVMNALIGKAVEACELIGCSHLTYGKYRYSEQEDSLSAFKKRNGFEELLVPKYYIPLTLKGELLTAMGLHKGMRALIPDTLQSVFKRARARLHRTFR